MVSDESKISLKALALAVTFYEQKLGDSLRKCRQLEQQLQECREQSGAYRELAEYAIEEAVNA